MNSLRSAKSGGLSRANNPPALAIVAGDGNDGDRQGDGGAKVNNGRAIETPAGERLDRARGSQRRWRRRVIHQESKAVLEYQKPMFSEDEERRPLLTEEELYDACLHAAATVVIAVALGCKFEDCRLDDGYPWPTSVSRIEIKYPKEWSGKAGAFSFVAMIHEAGAMAVAKRHGRGPHLINHSDKTRDLLNLPRVWKAIEALAQYIEDNYEGDGCYGAMGTDAGCLEDANALGLIVDKLIGDADLIPDTPQ
jgi:hypothetical protein